MTNALGWSKEEFIRRVTDPTISREKQLSFGRGCFIAGGFNMDADYVYWNPVMSAKGAGQLEPHLDPGAATVGLRSASTNSEGVPAIATMNPLVRRNHDTAIQHDNDYGYIPTEYIEDMLQAISGRTRKPIKIEQSIDSGHYEWNQEKHGELTSSMDQQSTAILTERYDLEAVVDRVNRRLKIKNHFSCFIPFCRRH